MLCLCHFFITNRQIGIRHTQHLIFDYSYFLSLYFSFRKWVASLGHIHALRIAYGTKKISNYNADPDSDKSVDRIGSKKKLLCKLQL